MKCDEESVRALYALQAVLIRARWHAYEAGDTQLAALLDDAEYLPYLIGSGDSAGFRSYVERMAERWNDAQFHDRFLGDVPCEWTSSEEV